MKMTISHLCRVWNLTVYIQETSSLLSWMFYTKLSINYYTYERAYSLELLARLLDYIMLYLYFNKKVCNGFLIRLVLRYVRAAQMYGFVEGTLSHIIKIYIQPLRSQWLTKSSGQKISSFYFYLYLRSRSLIKKFILEFI